MDENKQIEEIHKVVRCNCNKEGIAKRCPERIANAIYNAGYRKADDVIDHLMNAKDTSELTEKEIEFFVKHNAKVRQETVREFICKLEKELFAKCTYILSANDPNEYDMKSEEVNALLGELAKEYGVEVEE